MKVILKAISYVGLAFTVIPAMLVYSGAIEYPLYLNLILLGTFLWFGSAVFWIKGNPGL